MSTSGKKTIIVVGAGAGGNAIAARLAKEGHDVTVYEKNDFGGGRCSLIYKDGHRFDQGPSFYLMPEVFEETFAELDEKIEDHVKLLKCPTNYMLHFHDGKRIELTCDMAKMAKQVEKFEGKGTGAVNNLIAFIGECQSHYEDSLKLALKTNFPRWHDLLRLKYLPKVFTMHLYDSVYTRASKYFKTDYMRRAFTFQSMYIGMSPYDAPGAYNLLQGTEIVEGIWYPEGGFYKVLKALEQIAINKYNAKFNYGAGVKKINIDSSGNATGVTLEDGKVVNADLVVCNADLVYAYNNLLPKTPYAEKLGDKAELTSSSVSFYWSMNRKVPELSTHNIFLAKEYKKSFDEIFFEYDLPSEPSFYVNVPSRIDPSAAPEGKDSVIVLVPLGHMTNKKKQDFDATIKRAREHVINTIEKRLGIQNFRDFIEHEALNDPRTWQQKFNLWKGSILGLSHSILQVLYLRPGTRSHLFKNLYFVGASAHPGTGVPVVLCGAKLVADQIKEDLAKPKTNAMVSPQMIVKALLVLLLSMIMYTFVSLC